MTSSQPTCIDHGKTTRYASTRREGRVTTRHRLVYADHVGVHFSTLDGLVVRHTCDNHRCINPDHLEIGTQLENMQDMWERTRVPPHRGKYAAIKAGYEPGNGPLLAVQLGVSESTVYRILKKETQWQSTSKR